ncbi:hypothetical protein BGZ46_010339 [Entomortierella lignicola]|nr:hypothetical protein BGZ46_010339 [Entomortierella lignicola]
MESLPAELLLVIIAHIDQSSIAACNCLNKRWYGLTRGLLYKRPRLIRPSAIEAFLRTVDTLDMYRYIQSVDHSNSSKNIQLTHSSSPPSSCDILSSRNPISTHSEAKSSKLGCADVPPRLVPLGALVEQVDLSMLPHRWETVNYGSIQPLAQGCPFVSVLDLRDCLMLRDNSVQVIAEQLGPRQLRSLILSGCKKITDLAVLSLCTHAIRLENLELSQCDKISDISILELGSSQVGISRTIKSLDLSYCTRITDTGIKGLQIGATQLNSLNLEGCYGVLMSDDDGLEANGWEDLDDIDDDD